MSRVGIMVILHMFCWCVCVCLFVHCDFRVRMRNQFDESKIIHEK